VALVRLSKWRGGTPTGERVPMDARRAPSSVLPEAARMKVGVRRLEIRVCRRSASLLCSRMNL